MRVRQWPKNLLVFGAPAAAGNSLRAGVLGRVGLAAAAFCMLSSGAYLLNDLRDAAEDRRHPVKRHRPLASRAISPDSAFVVAVAAVAAGLVLSATLGPASLAIAGAYVALNFAYTAWLRLSRDHRHRRRRRGVCDSSGRGRGRVECPCRAGCSW